MKPKDFDLDEFIQDLQGTCKTMESALPEGMTIEDLTEDDLENIDQEIFNCETCNWWCEVSEMASEEGSICRDCIGEGEEE